MPTNLPLDRLVRKEVALGVVRELLPPTNHVGLSLLAPWLDVESDDVIFDYAKGLTTGLAPARAEDAESELAQKDDRFVGIGRAAVIDWAIKDHYSASDVSRYREALLVSDQVQNTLSLPLTINRMLDGFQDKVARDTALRRQKLDNRMEWLIMTAIETGGITYNDGKIKFTVDYGRPANQTDQAPTGGTWDLSTSDPIGDLITAQQFMYHTYGVRMTRAVCSRWVLNAVLNSSKFAARTGLAVAGSPASPSSPATPIDPRYLLDGWGPSAAVAVLERATGIKFIEYDSVYRTRPVGSNTVTTNYFMSNNKILLLPDEEDVAQIATNEIGFGKMLTSPHPEGNWGTGYYEWEEDTKDPWGHNIGTGVKAFPVFPHMDLTYTMVPLSSSYTNTTF